MNNQIFNIAKRILCVGFMMCLMCACDELKSDPDWPDIYNSTWQSNDGKVQFNVGKAPTTVLPTGPAGEFTVKVDSKFYSGYFPASSLFLGANEPKPYRLWSVSSSDNEAGEGEIILKKKKNNNTITVVFTGAIDIPEVQLTRKPLSVE